MTGTLRAKSSPRPWPPRPTAWPCGEHEQLPSPAQLQHIPPGSPGPACWGRETPRERLRRDPPVPVSLGVSAFVSHHHYPLLSLCLPDPTCLHVCVSVALLGPSLRWPPAPLSCCLMPAQCYLSLFAILATAGHSLTHWCPWTGPLPFTLPRKPRPPPDP